MMHDSYRVLSRLGAGSTGSVFLARDLDLDRDVALKVMNRALARNDLACRAFVAEARALARVDHPNVVAVHRHDVIVQDGINVPFYVMEYMARGDLRRHIEADGGVPLPIDEALDVIECIGAGLGAIHDGGRQHLDIKPSNVLVSATGRLALSDFGVQEWTAASSQKGKLFLGTPSYCAPEIMTGQALDAEGRRRADIYSLATIAYELLVGQLPYRARGLSELVGMKMSMTAEHPSDFASDLTSTLDDLLLAGLSPDPADRPGDPRSLASSLRAALDGPWGDTDDLRILVADDDEDFRLLLEAVLRDAFPAAEVLCFGDGHALLDEARCQAPSLVVLDLQMPHMGGGATTQALREEVDAEMGIVVVTAVGSAQDWRRLRALGADAFLVKPLQPRDLVAACRRVMGAPERATRPAPACRKLHSS